MIIWIQLSNWCCVDTRYKAPSDRETATSVARATGDTCRDHQASEKFQKQHHQCFLRVDDTSDVSLPTAVVSVLPT